MKVHRSILVGISLAALGITASCGDSDVSIPDADAGTKDAASPQDANRAADGSGPTVDAAGAPVDGGEQPEAGVDAGGDAGGEIEAGVDAGTDASAGAEAGVDAGDAGTDADAGPVVKRVFVTSETYSGNLGGLDGADAKCQALADKVHLGGVYKAWLSAGGVGPANRFTKSTVPYALIDGTIIANDYNDLTTPKDGNVYLKNPIFATEVKGGPVPTGTNLCATAYGHPYAVWTNTEADGTPSNENASCGDWTSTVVAPGKQALMGEAGRFRDTWTDVCKAQDCNGKSALYCFEQ